MSYAQERLKRLRASMRANNIDIFFIRDLSSIKWISAFDEVFDDEAAHAVIITCDRAFLHTDSRYAYAASEAAKNSSFEVDASSQSHASYAATILVDQRGRSEAESTDGHSAPLSIALESTMMLGEFRQFEEVFVEHKIVCTLRETKGFVAKLRSVKDAEEIRRLKAAQKITDAAFSHLLEFVRPGLTERAVLIELEDFMIRSGAHGLAFSSIVAAGPNGASPHAIPGSTVLEAGQSLVLDFGARRFGYCSDMTRTLFLGEPTPTMKRAYEALCEANESVEAFLKPGVSGAQAQELAEGILASAGFSGAMGHSLGHGVGIDVHEEPVLAPRNDRPLEIGNVITVEPGIYIAQEFGMRLEDFGVISKGGFDVFTQSSHDMVII